MNTGMTTMVNRLLPFLLLLPMQSMAQNGTIIVGGLERTYTLRLPGSYTPAVPMPMVVALHGGFGSGIQLEEQSQLTVKAEEEGFIVVYPDGSQTGFLNIRTWNAGGCCGGSVANNIDDVGFIDTLLDLLILENSIDTTRIYVTGMSNGGFMSHRLACELSHRIAAIAPVAASMTIAECQPERPVPVIAINSYLDESVPYLGGIGSGVSDHYNSPLDSVLNAWAGHAGCTFLNDTLVNDQELTHIRWDGCSCGVQMELYLTRDGGHSWAGGTLGTAIGDPPSTTVSANDLMWEFFQRYTLNCAITTAVDERDNPLSVQAFPNPTNGLINIRGSAFRSLLLSDALGRTVLELELDDTGKTILDLQHLPDGIYMAHIRSVSGEVQSLRIALQE